VPHYSINVSYDDGVNWDAGTVIDYPSWAMGTMTEVEPDVVLVTYMNWHWNRQEYPLLAQLIRVTPDGIAIDYWSSTHSIRKTSRWGLLLTGVRDMSRNGRFRKEQYSRIILKEAVQ